MKNKERILNPVGHIRGGIILPHLKKTADYETVIMPPPKTVRIPMLQHIGAPAEPVVKAGDRVFVGTLIGESGGFVSSPVHSSVSGTVTSVEDYIFAGKRTACAVIESDGLMENDPGLKLFNVESAEDIAKAAELCGLVGLGGAGFPTRVKLSLNGNTRIDTLIINGAECEPYITSDYRACIEDYNDIIDGIRLLKDRLGLEKVIICIESNKEKAINKLYTIASGENDINDCIKLMKLPTSYPQGAEKVIVYSATGRTVPIGKLPADVGCIVMNITSVAVLSRFIKTGMPLVAKRITVDGTAVNEPKNITVPIGTSVEDVLEFAGVNLEEVSEIIFGGPMMGVASHDLGAVVEKRTNALTVMKGELNPSVTTPCIRCGRCASACPMRLYPASAEAAINHGLTDSLKKLNVNYCMECGSCSFVCPAKRPLTQIMRLAKAELRKENRK